jgi:ferredoxin
MAHWFARGLLRGIVTTRYPARDEMSVLMLPTPPVFNPELLTGALVDELVVACPSQALRREQQTLRYDVGACTACERCLRLAGDAARPCGTVELAATARDQLVKYLPILGGCDE